MTTEDWARVTQLFGEALELSPEERTAFLSDRERDPIPVEIRTELESLLEAHDRVNSTAAFESPFARSRAPETEAPQSVGPYNVVRELGRGGMGTVYLATRSGVDFDQTVALKVVRSSGFGDEVANRFRHERKILASLNHPNIARLFDGGSTETGQAYIAMEYVDGAPITTYCDTHRLSVARRLEVFHTICRAVQHAHQNLVVHRDLKPSNILVTDDGVIKLLDFGIAKLLDDEKPNEAEPLTIVGQRVMTPEYASPEQIRGDGITTSTDVYQLGVLLYELLTGRHPYRRSGRRRHEVERVILEQEPERPSTSIRADVRTSTDRATTVSGLRRALRGDLDNIILKALQKDPVRRYESVEQLAKDIRSHASGHPVAARGDSAGYRLRKFITRNAVGVGVAAVAFVVLTAFTAALVVQRTETLAQRDLAQSEAAKSERIVAFMQQMLGSVDPAQDGRGVTVAQVLDNAAKEIDAGLSQDPVVEAELRRTIGITYQNLGLYEEAAPQIRKSLALRRAFLGASDVKTAESIKDLGLLKHWEGDLDSAAYYYQDAIARFRESQVESAGYSEALNDYGTLLMDRALYPEAEVHFREALAMSTNIFGSEHMMVASNLVNLGLVRHWQLDVEAADSLYHRALALQKRLVGETHMEVAYTLNNLAWVYIDRKDLATADSLFRQSLAIRRASVGDKHPSVGLAIHNLATLVTLERGEYEDAEALLTEAQQIFDGATTGDHPNKALVRHSLAKLRLRQGRPAEAAAYLREAVRMREAIFGTDHETTVRTQRELLDVLLQLGRTRETRPAVAND